MLYDSIPVKVQSRQIYREKVDWWFPRAKRNGGNEGVTSKGFSVSFWGDEKFLKWIILMLQPSKYARNH